MIGLICVGAMAQGAANAMILNKAWTERYNASDPATQQRMLSDRQAQQNQAAMVRAMESHNRKHKDGFWWGLGLGWLLG